MTTTANQPKELWEAVLGDLQMHVTRPNYETWLKNTVGIAFRDGEFVVGTPNAFVAEMLEQRMYSLISLTAERVVKGPVEVRFQVLLSEEVDAADEPEDADDQRLTEAEPTGVLHPTFSPKATSGVSSWANPMSWLTPPPRLCRIGPAKCIAP